MTDAEKDAAIAALTAERDALKAEMINVTCARDLNRLDACALRAAWRTINEPEKHAGGWLNGIIGCRFRLCNMSRAGVVCAWHVCTCGEHASKAEARKILDGGQ
jgi:hypothetical protein